MKGLLLLALVAASMRTYHATTFTSTIAENGTRFRQKIEIDKKNRYEIFHVPAHNGLMENHEMYDFKRGLVMRCMPKIKTCFLTKFNRKEYENPALLKRNMRKFQMKHIRPGKAERQEVLHNDKLVIVDVSSVKNNKRFLSARMRRFRGNYALYREVKLPKNAEVIKDDGTAFVKPKNRTKRGMCWPKRKYIKAPGNGYHSCTRASYCTLGQCIYHHMTSNAYYTCWCCHNDNTAQECYKHWAKCTYGYHMRK